MSDKLQKVLAHAGRGSRRQLEAKIDEGRVTVNGKVAKLGDRVELHDRIVLDGKPVFIKPQGSTQIKALIYHKPEGEIVSRSDPAGRPSVFAKLPSIADSRWVAVGRLDINTSGLLLFTNDGDLANKLMHPSSEVEREYLARVRGQLTQDNIDKLTRSGIELDGQLAKFESVTVGDLGQEGTNHWYRVVIKEGRYREVRRLFDAVHHPVSRLKRIRYGSVKLTRDVKQGEFSKMAPKQLEKLILSTGVGDQFAEKTQNRPKKRSIPDAEATNTKVTDKNYRTGRSTKGANRGAKLNKTTSVNKRRRPSKK